QQHLHACTSLHSERESREAPTELSRTRASPSGSSSGTFPWSSSTGTARIRCGELFEGGEEEFVHGGGEGGELRGAGVAGGAEGAVEGVGGGGGADGKTEAGDAVGAELFEGFVGVGFSVARFVAVVVGEAVREDDQKAVGGAGFGLWNFAGTADAGAEARVAGWLELVEPRSAAGAGRLPDGCVGRG